MDYSAQCHYIFYIMPPLFTCWFNPCCNSFFDSMNITLLHFKNNGMKGRSRLWNGIMLDVVKKPSTNLVRLDTTLSDNLTYKLKVKSQLKSSWSSSSSLGSLPADPRGHKECGRHVWADQEKAEPHRGLPIPHLHTPTLPADALWVHP